MKSMKNILLTGGAQGIGRAIAENLLAQGYKLYVIDKQQNSYVDIMLKEKPEHFYFFRQDIAQREGLGKLLEELKDIKFDAIINNAGEVYLEKWDQLSLETWDRTLAVNTTAPLQIVHELRHNLRAGASIVNIASTDGSTGAFDTVAYAVSKAALTSLTKSLAVILGTAGVRVNAVAPGWVETEMTEDTMPKEAAGLTPLGRNARAEDIANLVEYLISDRSSFINGEVITIDGGLAAVDYTLKKESENNIPM